MNLTLVVNTVVACFLFCFWNSLSIEIAKVVCIVQREYITNDEDTVRAVFILYTNVFKLALLKPFKMHTTRSVHLSQE